MAANPVSFADWPWRHWGQVQPEATAIVVDGVAISWRRLVDDVDHLPVLAFDSPHVAITANNDYHTLLVLLAAWQQGLKTLLLNPAFSPELEREVLANTGITTGLDPAEIGLTAAPSDAVAPFDGEAVVTFILTSGSSGLPKAVAHSAHNHLASANGLFTLMPFERQDCWLLSLPLFHVSGLAIVWRWLAKGAVLNIADTKGEALLTALQGVSHASLVPTQLQRLLQGEKPASLRAVLLGGAVIPQALVDEAEKRGICCWCGYGMTEMASTICAKRADGRFSVGTPLPGRMLRLSPHGEVLVNGDTLSPGYLVGGVITPLSDNWFATKDKAQWREGELEILGRFDNMFICGGENVQPEAVERVLLGFSGIEQVFVLPLPDATWGQIPVALVQGNVEPEALIAWAKDMLPAYQVPRRVLTLPNSLASGGIKLSRNALRNWLVSQN